MYRMFLHFNPTLNVAAASHRKRGNFFLPLQRYSEEWCAAIEPVEKNRFEVYRYIVQVFSYVVHDVFPPK